MGNNQPKETSSELVNSCRKIRNELNTKTAELHALHEILALQKEPGMQRPPSPYKPLPQHFFREGEESDCEFSDEGEPGAN